MPNQLAPSEQRLSARLRRHAEIALLWGEPALETDLTEAANALDAIEMQARRTVKQLDPGSRPASAAVAHVGAVVGEEKVDA